MKAAYDCEGTSTRQHNEPAGYQDVWHLHAHVFPRYPGDRLYERHEEKRWATPEERAPYAANARGFSNRCLTPLRGTTCARATNGCQTPVSHWRASSR